MPLRNFPDEFKEFALQVYEKPAEDIDISKTHIAFSGTPQKHHHDPDKVILVSDPYSSNISYYEFQSKDISYVEELVNSVDLKGNTIILMRLWVKKQSIAIRSTPFIVADTISRK